MKLQGQLLPTIFTLALGHHSTSLAGHEPPESALGSRRAPEPGKFDVHRPAWRAGGGFPLPYSFKSTQGRRWTHRESTGQRGRTGTHREGAGHPARELDIQGGSRTPREGVGPQGEQGPQHCWGPPALTQPRSGLPSSQGELSEAKIISACSEICTEPQLSLLMTKGLETTAAPRAKGLK